MDFIKTVNRFAILFGAAGTALGLGTMHAASAAPAAPPRAVTRAAAVSIKMFAFSPQVLTVAPGTTVVWTNGDEDPHAVVANDRSFHSTALDTGGRYSFTFSRPGNYSYFCSLHPHMIGKIIVKAN